MISLQGVSKKFGKRLAVDDLSLEVPRGQIFGMLGHNGAGKSTTIGMLLGQVFPDEGSIRIAGADVFQQRARALGRVGAIFESPSFYDYLSGASNLRIFAEYTGGVDARRMAEVVELVGLKDRIRDPVRVYSHGMRQRLALAQSLLPEPEMLILDEPNDGLDPEGIHEMRNLILKLNREWGLTILFSSHQLSEVQHLCTHLAVMKEGRLLFSGEWRQMGLERAWLRLKVDRQAEAQHGLERDGLVASFNAEGHGKLAGGVEVAAVAEWLVRERFRIEAIAPIERDLEDVYLEMVQGKTERMKDEG